MVSIKIEPNPLIIANGKTQILKATGNYKDGTIRDISGSVTWSSSDPGIAAIGKDTGNKKHVKGIQEGAVTIIATSALGISGTAQLKVMPSALESIKIKPRDLSVHLGHIQQFTATGIFSDGKQKDMTSLVNWSTSNTTLPVISNTPGSKGLAISPPTGTITIIAEDPNTHIQGSTSLTVTTTKLVSISISPKDQSIPLGRNQIFTAIGTYVDGSTSDITGSVIWTVSQPTMAAVKDDPDGKGIITSLSVGKTAVKATDPTIIISGSTSLTITQPILESILIEPSDSPVYLGKIQPLSAIGVYSDNSKKDITESVVFTSSDPSVALISEAKDKTNPLLMTIYPGTVKIKARDKNTDINTTFSLTITQPELISITVQPSNPDVLLGKHQTFTAIGTFADGKTKDITQNVTWSSSKPIVTKITNNGKRKGLAISKQKGTVTISAVDPATGIKGNTVLHSTMPALVAISIAPSSPKVFAGDAVSFKATGKYSNGKTEDITDNVQWSVSEKSRADFSNNEDKKGLVRFISPGSVTIHASAKNTGITGNTTITINPAKLKSIEISSSAESISLGQVQKIYAKGTFIDGTIKDITKSLVFTSSDKSVATIDGNTASGVSLVAISPGIVTIRATDPATHINSWLQIKIIPSKLISISVTPENSSISLSRSQEFTALGIFSDGNRKDITEQVIWKSSDPEIVRISNASRKKGRATALAEGASIIHAMDPDTGISGETSLTAKTFWK